MIQHIYIDELPPGLNGQDGLKRMHYQKYRKVRTRFQWHLKRQKPVPMTGTTVSITFVRYEVQPMDWDNHAASFKVIGDALVREGIIDDDSPDVILDFNLEKKKISKLAEQKCEIIIESLT